jgi:hypothetical protein
MYTEDTSDAIKAVIDRLVDEYFPDGRPGASCPFGLSATVGAGGVTLAWRNGTEIPTSVRVLRDSQEIAAAAPADPPTYTDGTAQPGQMEYELIFTMPGAACEPLTTTYDGCIASLAAVETPGGAVRLTWVNGLAYPGGVRITRDDDGGSVVLQAAYDGAAEEYLDESVPDFGVVTYRVAPVDGQCEAAEVVMDLTCEPLPEVCDNNRDDDCDGFVDCADPDCDGQPSCAGERFRRGDANRDGSMNIADAVYILQNLFAQGPAISCKDAADSNDDEAINIADPVYILQNLFAQGPGVPAPGPGACGPDTTGSGPDKTGPQLIDCADYGVEACDPR